MNKQLLFEDYIFIDPRMGEYCDVRSQIESYPLTCNIDEYDQFLICQHQDGFVVRSQENEYPPGWFYPTGEYFPCGIQFNEKHPEYKIIAVSAWARYGNDMSIECYIKTPNASSNNRVRIDMPEYVAEAILTYSEKPCLIITDPESKQDQILNPEMVKIIKAEPDSDKYTYPLIRIYDQDGDRNTYRYDTAIALYFTPNTLSVTFNGEQTMLVTLNRESIDYLRSLIEAKS
jgi:hypothetical protein